MHTQDHFPLGYGHVTTGELRRLLENHPDGLSQGEIAMILFQVDGPNTRRQVRRIAAMMKPEVVSAPGFDGMRLIQYATDEELLACENLHSAQAKDELHTAKLYRDARVARQTMPIVEVAHV